MSALSYTQRHPIVTAAARVFMDGCCIAAAFALGSAFAQGGAQPWQTVLSHRAFYLWVFLAVWFAAAADQRLFAQPQGETLISLLYAVAKAYFACVLFSVFFIALVQDGIDKGFFVIFALLALCILLVVRLTLRLSLWNLQLRGYNARRVLIIGANNRTAHLVEVFRAHEQYGYQIEGYLEDDESRRALLALYNVPFLGKIAELERILTDRVIDCVYVSLPVRSHYEAVQNIAHLCEGVGVPVRLVADLFPLRQATSDVTRLADIPLLSLTFEPELHTRFALKRAVEIAVTCILLMALSPLFLLVALLIKLDSQGPVIATQTCIGWDMRPFNVYRFRVKAAHGGESGQPAEAAAVTRTGAFLQRYGLHDLPQLVNVLLGHISLTGPRPPIPPVGEDHSNEIEAGSYTPLAARKID